jgi:hypothetical protein
VRERVRRGLVMSKVKLSTEYGVLVRKRVRVREWVLGGCVGERVGALSSFLKSLKP